MARRSATQHEIKAKAFLIDDQNSDGCSPDDGESGLCYAFAPQLRKATMRTLLLLAGVLAVSGCTDAIRLTNPATGQTATCGPYPIGVMVQASSREARCLQDFKEQGFVRAAN